MTDTQRRMVLLEGNIGAGKTTIGRRVAASGAFSFVEEPTRIWQEKYDVNMLDLFYSDTERWAFTFQINAFVTRAKTWHEIARHTDHDHVMLERSIYCDRHVFAKNCYQTGLFSKAEFELYLDLWQFTTSNFVDRPDLILYLRTPATVCLERMKMRGRSEEVGVPLDYLLQLEALHDEWLLDNPHAVVLDGMKQWSAGEILEIIERNGGHATATRN